ncbi:MAG: bifunctional riboflavin kinase/FAD synthetase [Prevotellaceae bacterium]|jgi:riboflavin kinase/FMN adenylyltransferase|nr:bifunctional riboflavin kinase/FAD synthetase [Prevotellaceae bacterium]
MKHVATTGFFDGVHKGHRAVLEKVVREAQAQGKESMVVTFWPHPRTVLGQDAEKLRLLNSVEEKKRLLLGLGIQHIEIIPFSHELAAMTTAEFFDRYLRQELNVDHLVVGHDHRLGNRAHDDFEAMKKLGAPLGITVERVEAVSFSSFFGQNTSVFVPKNNTVSSTKIREALKGGDVKTANEYLGYQYGLQGVVVEGSKMGRQLGFPTANMQLYEPLKQLPADGVYAVLVTVARREYRGVMNVGVRPTLKTAPIRVIETHIFDFDEDIYGQPIEVRLVQRIREERRFNSLDELKQQIAKDKESSFPYFEKY